MAFCQLSGSIGGSAKKRKSTMAGTSPSTDTRSCTTGAIRAKTSGSKRAAGQRGPSVMLVPVSGSLQSPAAHAPGSGCTQGSDISMNSGVASSRM